mgnify:CR=1 FL=1
MSLLIAFAVLSIAVSFICSILEAALLSITPSYIAQQKLTRPKLYEKLKALKEKIDQPLAAILTLNTVAHTVGATGVGAQVTVVFGDGYLGIASAIMTVLILILSEILPKTIGARYWPALTPVLPGILNGMIFILKPFIWLSDQIMKLFGGGHHLLFGLRTARCHPRPADGRPPLRRGQTRFRIVRPRIPPHPALVSGRRYLGRLHDRGSRRTGR